MNEPSRSNEQQLYTVLLIVFVSFIGISIAYPIFPPLFLSSENTGLMANPWVASHRSVLLGVTLAAYPLGQFIGSPIIGALSDKSGRRKILLISLAGTILGYLLTALSLENGQLILLILSRLFTGIAESNYPLAQSLIADMHGINKHRGFGGVTMAASTGFVVGPLLGGFLSDSHVVSWFTVSFPFYVATALAGAALVFAYWTLHDGNIVRDPRAPEIWQQFNIIGNLRELMSDGELKYLLISGLIFTLGVDLFYEFGPVFLTGHWSMTSAQLALYNMVLSLSIGLGGLYLPQYLAQKFSPRLIVVPAIIVFSLVLALITALPSLKLVMLLFVVIGCVIPLPSTAINVQMSDVAGDDRQGKLMGMQMGLRMFGDTIICLFAGVIIIFSVALPLLFGSVAALFAAFIYQKYIKKES